MKFHVEMADVAELETEDILFWINGRSSERSGGWQTGLLQVVSSLEEFPRRYRLAPENEYLEIEVRQVLYGSYRILFTLLDLDEDGTEETIRILHIRHASRLPLGNEETEEG